MTYDTINDARTIAGNGEGTLLAGRYRVVRQLGQGGMGSVWLAEDTQLDNKLFAIKMLPAILVSNKRAYRQLKDEALVAMKLTHPNIVTLRAFEENNGNPFLVMDYIDGQTLDDYLAERETLPEDEVIRVLRPIAAALDYAHREGVVHRDVKPANVIIRKDGHPFILDFGIAREIQETLTRVTGKLSSGTLLYMSPEQLMGAQPKPPQDVYSFAAMAYECLKGEPPFVRGAIEDQIKNKQPDPLPTEVLTGNAAILAAGVMAGLAKKPENRPASCTSVLEGSGFNRVEHVERVEGGDGRARTPIAPQGGRASTRAVTGGPRPVAALKSLLAVVALGLAAFGGWWWKSGQSARSIDAKHVSPVIEAKAKAERERVLFKAGHKGIQLWEGGPYWATTNIGAEKPEDYGYYFGWGDTVGYKREGNSWVASNGGTKSWSWFGTPTHRKSYNALRNDGWITAEGVLSLEHDAAHVQWGGGWRMPTKQELDDLKSKCDWERTTVNGVKGYVARGRGTYASVSIFLPCAGSGYRTSLSNAGSRGHYWSSVPSSGYGYDAWNLYFYSGGHNTDSFYRYDGYPVRPVQGFTK